MAIGVPRKFTGSPPDVIPNPPKGPSGPYLNEGEGWCFKSHNIELSLSGECVVEDDYTFTQYQLYWNFSGSRCCMTDATARERYGDPEDDNGYPYWPGYNTTEESNNYSDCYFSRSRFYRSGNTICDCPDPRTGVENCVINTFSGVKTFSFEQTDSSGITGNIDDCCDGTFCGFASPSSLLFALSLEFSELAGNVMWGDCCEANNDAVVNPIDGSAENIPLYDYLDNKIDEFFNREACGIQSIESTNTSP